MGFSNNDSVTLIETLKLDDLLALFPKRNPDSHKGDYGHVLVIGGDFGMAGAARLAAEGAARVGAGLVSVATRSAHVPIIVTARPEIMAHGVDDPAALPDLLARATVIVLGPGLGQSAWSQTLFEMALATEKPCVIDADGLNLLAHHPRKRGDWILTPHPGEAARLLGQPIDHCQNEREKTVHRLQEQYGGYCLLKGKDSLIKGPEEVCFVCKEGNPGMASGGMGDILSGVIGGLLAQSHSPDLALKLGVCLHACAGDQVILDCGIRGLLALDLLPYIQKILNFGFEAIYG